MLKEKWSQLKEMKYVLGITYRATVAMQNRELTLSDLFGIWMKMELHLKKCTNAGFKTKIAEELLKSVMKRKEKIYENPFMCMALYLDLKYHRILPEIERVKANEGLINLFHRLGSAVQTDTSTNPNNATNNTSSDSIDLNFDEDAELNNYLTIPTVAMNRVIQTDDIEILLDNFDPELESVNMKAMDYWESQKYKQPQLYKLAEVVYSIPPTETQIEREFSQLDYVFNDRRCNLTEERLGDIMVLNLNPQLFDAIKEDELKELNSQIPK